MVHWPPFTDPERFSPVEVVGAIKNLGSTDLSGLSDQELLDHARNCHRILCVAQAALAGAAGAINKRGAGLHDGAMSTKAWMRSQLRMSVSDASALVDAGSALPELPRFAAEFADGNIGLDHLAPLVWLRRKAGPEIAIIGDLVLHPIALEHGASEVRRMAKLIREHYQDTDDPVPEPDRFLNLNSTLDGVWSLEAGLTPEGGAILKTALDAVMIPPAPDDDRSYTQRLHDAFIDVLLCALNTGELPGSGGEKPHLGVLVRLEDLNPDPTHAPGVPTATPRTGSPQLPAELVELLKTLGRDPRALADAIDSLTDTVATPAEDPESPADLQQPTATPDAEPVRSTEALPGWLTDTPEDLDEPTLYVPAEWQTEADLHDAPHPVEPVLDWDPDWATMTGPGWTPPAWLDDLDEFGHTPDGQQRQQLLLPGLAPGSSGHLPTPGQGGLADWGARLSPAATQRLACECAIHRIILGSRELPLSTGPRTRLVTSAQRRLLVARDGGCRFPGCTMPPKWTQAHHVRYFSHGGLTVLNNLVLLCSFHHHRVHDHGWTMKFDGHTVTVDRPDGTRLNVPETSPAFTDTT